jgi:hypothetical protein
MEFGVPKLPIALNKGLEMVYVQLLFKAQIKILWFL